MTEDTLLPFDLPAVRHKKLTVAWLPLGGRAICSRLALGVIQATRIIRSVRPAHAPPLASGQVLEQDFCSEIGLGKRVDENDAPMYLRTPRLASRPSS
jgi:hypothetical protein